MDDDLLDDTEEDLLLDAAAAAAAAAEEEARQREEPSAVEYQRECRKEGVICCSQWVRACTSHASDVSLHHYGLGKRGAPPFATSLSLNTHVQALDLGDNGLGSDGVTALLGALMNGGAPELRTLSLRQNQAGGEGADAVADLLRSPHPLANLDFAGNAVGNAGATAIAEALADNRTLEALVLEHNSIEDEGASSIAHALGQNHTLTSLSLEWNTITAEGGKALADALREALQGEPSLSVLNLGWNGLGDAAVAAIAKAVELRPPDGPLRDVRLHHNRANSPVAAVALARALGSLEVLDVSGNPLGTAGSAALLLAQQESRVRVAGSGGGDASARPSSAAPLPRCRLFIEDVCVRPDTTLAGLLRLACTGEEIPQADLEACGVYAAAAIAQAEWRKNDAAEARAAALALKQQQQRERLGDNKTGASKGGKAAAAPKGSSRGTKAAGKEGKWVRDMGQPGLLGEGEEAAEEFMMPAA